MSRRLLIKTCILLVVTTEARTQYIDFFQSFNSFLQPFTTAKPRNEVTKRPSIKHRQTNKHKYQDVIFFETEEFLKQKENARTVDPFNLYSTTTKPRRKNTKTTASPNYNAFTTHSPDFSKPNKTVNSNKIINNNGNVNHEVIRSISNNNREPYNNNVDNTVVNNARRINNYNGYNDNGYDNYGPNSETTSNRATNNIYGYQGSNYNRQTTQRPTTSNYYNNNAGQTTQKTTTNYYNNNAGQTTQKTTTNYYNNNARQTTQKPITDYYNNNARQTTQKAITDYYNNNARQTTQKPITDYYNNNARQTTQKPITDYYNNNARQTTQKTTTDYYNNNARQTTRKTTEYYNNGRQTTRVYENERTTRRTTNNRGIYGSHTTSNPLLNRPGVKPAVVDENKPPITNRPVTTKPTYERPSNTGTYRPVNTRPPYETERPRLPNRPPVNTRPPFESEQPISTGVARPILSGEPAVSDTGNDEPDIEIGPDEDEMSESERRRLYDICEQKCDEYKSARVKKVVALPLTPNSQGVEVNVSSCAPINIPLIIGGEVAQIEQFPHMALVGWKKIQSSGYSWKCGGSLVSEQYLLTAGHCTYHDKDYNVVRYYGPPQAVQLGSSIYNDRTATVVQISVVIRHPKYKLRRSYHDVALIKLVRTVSFSDKISPACLGVPPPVGDPVIATGWGKTEYGGDSSIELRSVSIPVWDMTECREIWGTSLKLPNGPTPDNQICAGERKGAKDTCQGDSGGPAQVQDGCAWRVVAVTSVGRSCGAPETPALYARVPRAFIASQVYTNAKPARDGSNQYGNQGTNGNNWGTGNSNSGNTGNNRGNENNRGNVNNQFGSPTVANVRPVQNNNGQNYDNNGAGQNNGQYFGGTQTAGSNNDNKYGSTVQNTGNNDWSVPVTTNNRYNQNNRNVYDQNNNAQIHRTTTNGYNNQNNNGQNGYNTNNYGQNGYNANNFGQNGYNANNYGQNGYNEQNQSSNTNDNGSAVNTYNDNGYNSYAVAGRPWWTK